MQQLAPDVLGISKTPWVFGQLVNSRRFFQNGKIYFLTFMAIWKTPKVIWPRFWLAFGSALSIYLSYRYSPQARRGRVGVVERDHTENRLPCFEIFRPVSGCPNGREGRFRPWACSVEDWASFLRPTISYSTTGSQTTWWPGLVVAKVPDVGTCKSWRCLVWLKKKRIIIQDPYSSSLCSPANLLFTNPWSNYFCYSCYIILHDTPFNFAWHMTHDTISYFTLYTMSYSTTFHMTHYSTLQIIQHDTLFPITHNFAWHISSLDKSVHTTIHFTWHISSHDKSFYMTNHFTCQIISHDTSVRMTNHFTRHIISHDTSVHTTNHFTWRSIVSNTIDVQSCTKCWRHCVCECLAMNYKINFLFYVVRCVHGWFLELVSVSFHQSFSMWLYILHFTVTNIPVSRRYIILNLKIK